MKRILLTAIVLLSHLLFTAPCAQSFTLDKDFQKCGSSNTDFAGYINNSIVKTMVLPDGSILAMGTAGKSFSTEAFLTLAKYLSNGQLDSLNFGINGKRVLSFGHQTTGFAFSIQSNGQIVICGANNMSNAGSSAIPMITRLNPDGSTDIDFGNGGIKTLRFDSVSISSGNLQSLAILNSGKIITAGMCLQNINGGTTALGLMKFKADGQLDSSFTNPSPDVPGAFPSIPGRALHKVSTPYFGNVHVFVEQTGDFVVPFTQNFNGVDDNRIMIYFISSGGSFKGKVETDIRTENLIVKKQTDGKYLFAGTLNIPGALKKIQIIRYNANLSLDNSFGSNGKIVLNTIGGAIFDNTAQNLTVNPDGKIIIAGYKSTPQLSSSEYGSVVIRLNPDGNLDTTFNGSGYIEPALFAFNNRPLVDVDAISNERFLISSSDRFSLARFAPDTVSFSTVATAAFNSFVSKQTAKFQNTSQNALQHIWNFGDGTEPISKVNPSHTYGQPGYYQISLNTTGPCGSGQVEKNIGVAGVQKIIPAIAADSGLVTTLIYGFGFNSSSQVKLEKGDVTILSDSIYFDPITETIKTNFLFRGAETGKYDVIVKSGIRIDTLKQGFEIQKRFNGGLWVQVNGPYKYGRGDAVLVNKPAEFKITYGVHGNQQAYAVPVMIQVKGKNIRPNLAIRFGNYLNLYNPPSYFFANRNTGFYEFPQEDGDTLYSIIVAAERIEPNSINELPLTVLSTTLGNTFQLQAFIGNTILNEEQQERFLFARQMGVCDLNQCVKCALGVAAGAIPPLGCAYGVFQVGCDVAALSNSAPGSTGSGVALYNLMFDFMGTTLSCAGLPAGGSEFLKKTFEGVELLLGVTSKNALDMFGDCWGASVAWLGAFGGALPPDCSPPPSGTDADWLRNCYTVGAFDPNEKIGPSDSVSKYFIRNNTLLNYVVKFENLQTATAPASEVYIYDTLDLLKMDISTLRFTRVSIADSSYTPFHQKDSFALDIDYGKEKGIIVRTIGKLDHQLGIIKWKFQTLDTATLDLVTNPFTGFLPPNKNGVEGTGYVSYTIEQKKGLPHGTEITNRASIVFDSNEPILTPVWSNKIDTIPPESRVLNDFKVLSDTSFSVRWSGSDAHSGIRSYDIFYTDNDTQYRIFTSYDTDSAVVKGQIGKTYKFFSVAKDRVSNKEAIPSDLKNYPDAVFNFTTGVPLPLQLLYFDGAKQNNTVRLNWSTLLEQNTSHFDIEHSTDGMVFSPIGVIKAVGNSNQKNDYLHVHITPSKGKNYYRLKLNDIDKTYQYSSVVKINFGGANVVEVSPNPTNGLITISGLISNEPSHIIFRDLNGRLIHQQNARTNSLVVDLSNYPVGTYILSIESDTKRSFHKIIRH